MGTGAISTNIGGISRTKTITRTGTVVTHNETLAVGKAAALTTRSSATAGVLTFGADPNIDSGKIDIAWTTAGANGVLKNATVDSHSESETYSVTFSGGTGTLPAADTSLQSYTDLVIDAADNTVVTSAAERDFVAADVGRILKVTAGTGFTKQAYTIESVASGAATLNAAVGTVASTGGTATLYEDGVVASVRTSVGFTIPGSSVKMISLYSEPESGGTASRALVDFCSSGPTSEWAADLNDDEPFLWADNSPVANPITGDSITTIELSSLTTAAPTVYLEIVYDASP